MFRAVKRALRMVQILGAALVGLAIVSVAVIALYLLATMGRPGTPAGGIAPAAATPAAPTTSTPTAADGDDLTGVSCRVEAVSGSGSGGTTRAAVVRAGSSAPRGPLTVAVVVIDTAGQRHDPTIVPLSGSPSESVTVAAPDGAGPVRDCLVTAIGSGSRVVYTGR